MQIDVRDIPSEGLAVSLDEDLAALGLSALLGSVAANLTVSRSGTSVSVDGALNASLRLACGRCLEEFPRSIEVPLRVTLEKEGGKASPAGSELKIEDLDVCFYSGEMIHIDDLLREEILLNLPMRPLCKEDCLGLCPRCGKDLNQGPCACAPEDRDPRWAPIRDYLKRQA